mmetsp:Transcript_32781/g.102642  ORF Transcript_32781/g.102642 Transcript_32781/m.102642 type:complete len:217 (-) Transcript_32781:483-1133(-)
MSALAPLWPPPGRAQAARRPNPAARRRQLPQPRRARTTPASPRGRGTTATLCACRVLRRSQRTQPVGQRRPDCRGSPRQRPRSALARRCSRAPRCPADPGASPQPLARNPASRRCLPAAVAAPLLATGAWPHPLARSLASQRFPPAVVAAPILATGVSLQPLAQSPPPPAPVAAPLPASGHPVCPQRLRPAEVGQQPHLHSPRRPRRGPPCSSRPS